MCARVYSNLGTRKVRDVTRDRVENRWVSNRIRRLPLSFPISAGGNSPGAARGRCARRARSIRVSHIRVHAREDPGVGEREEVKNSNSQPSPSSVGGDADGRRPPQTERA